MSIYIYIYIYIHTQSKHQDVSLAKGNRNGMWLMSKQKFTGGGLSFMVAHVTESYHTILTPQCSIFCEKLPIIPEISCFHETQILCSLSLNSVLL